MANYTFPDVVGITLDFDPATDRLLFPDRYKPADLRIFQDGPDLLVNHLGWQVRLQGVAPAEVDGSQFLFATGAVARFGSAGADVFAGGIGDDAFQLQAGGSDRVSAGDGNDLVDIGDALDATDRIDGGAGALDTLLVTNGNSTLVTLDATTVTGVEYFWLQSVQDGGVLRLKLHEATLATADGAVLFDGNSLGDGLFLDGRATTTGFSVSGSHARDTLRGGAGADTIDGGTGADVLSGGGGSDRFRYDVDIWGGGSDRWTPDTITDFGAGDRLDVFRGDASWRPQAPLVFNASALAFDPAADGRQDQQHAGDGLADVFWRHDAAGQRLQIWVDANDDGRVSDGDLVLNLANGTTGKQSVVASDFLGPLGRRTTDAAELVQGSAGADIVAAQGGNDTMVGGEGADILFGEAGDDSILGGAGDDWLQGGAGNDTLDGGIGADRLYGGSGNDTYHVRVAGVLVQDWDTDWGPGDGLDRVLSHVADYTLDEGIENGFVTLAAGARLAGNHEANLLVGGAGADTLVGNAGDDTLDGGQGANRLAGGWGDDTYAVRSAADIVIEVAGEGRDRVHSRLQSLALHDQVEDGFIVLKDGARLTGNALANDLLGNIGNDTLAGGDGADTLAGGDGADSMVGGAGSDTYLVDNAGDLVVEASGPGAGIDTVISSVTLALAANVENLLAGAGALAATGNGGGNTLRGNAGANVLDGREGADTMAGGAGDDTYRVDQAGDQVIEYVGGGTDTVVSAVDRALGLNQENLTLVGGARSGTGNALANTLRGTAQGDVLDGAGGSDSLWGGLGDDTYRVDVEQDVVVEGRGAGLDTVISTAARYTLGSNVENLTLAGSARTGVGNGLANVLRGSSAANDLDGAAGADTMKGGGGDDTYRVDNVLDVVFEAADGGIDTVVSAIDHRLGANTENLTLAGSVAVAGTGNALANKLVGNAAANALDGGAGADTMAGGLGDDTYRVDHARDSVLEARAAGNDTVLSTISWTLAASVENLTLMGSALSATGNDAANLLRGNTAANVLDGAEGADTMMGGSGDDTYHVDAAGDSVREAAGNGVDTVVSRIATYTLGDHVERLLLGEAGVDGVGNALANYIGGNGGWNRLDGGLGADTMAGGGGSDTYLVDNRGDVIVEGVSGVDRDTVITHMDWTLVENVENLTLTGTAALSGTGNAFSNTIVGNAGANVLNGLGGADTLAGGLGDDLYRVEQGQGWGWPPVGDLVVEEAGGGLDQVISQGDFELGDYVENLTLTNEWGDIVIGTGNAQSNVLRGGQGANELHGRDGNDTLWGGAGDDLLEGDRGRDVLTGGAGEDRFVYNSVHSSLSGMHDVITDFVPGVDILEFSQSEWASGDDYLTSLQFIGTDGFSANASGQVRYEYDASSNSIMLLGSTDADRAAEFTIQLLGLSSFEGAVLLFHL